MRLDERRDVFTRIPFVLLALFLAFVAYTKLRVAQTDRKSLQATHESLLKESLLRTTDLETAKNNETSARSLAVEISKLFAKIPGPKDTPLLIRQLSRLGMENGVSLSNMSFGKGAGQKASAYPGLKRRSVSLECTGSYYACRNFLLDFEHGASNIWFKVESMKVLSMDKGLRMTIHGSTWVRDETQEAGA